MDLRLVKEHDSEGETEQEAELPSVASVSRDVLQSVPTGILR